MLEAPHWIKGETIQDFRTEKKWRSSEYSEEQKRLEGLKNGIPLHFHFNDTDAADWVRLVISYHNYHRSNCRSTVSVSQYFLSSIRKGREHKLVYSWKELINGGKILVS